MGNMMSKRVKRRGKMSRQRLQGETDAMVCYMYGIRFIDTYTYINIHMNSSLRPMNQELNIKIYIFT